MEQDKFQGTADVTMQHQNESLARGRKDLEVPRVTHDREKEMALNHVGNLGSKTPKDDVSRKYLEAEISSSSVSQDKSMSSRGFVLQDMYALNLWMIFLCGLKHLNS
jgi:hypothetical protein